MSERVNEIDVSQVEVEVEASAERGTASAERGTRSAERVGPAVSASASSEFRAPSSALDKSALDKSALDKPPSAKKRRIYEQVALHLRTQEDVAREFRMTQARVSQIVAEVRQFMDQLLPDGGIDALRALAKLARHEQAEGLARRKVNYGRCEEVYKQSKEPLVTTRTVYRGNKRKIMSVVVTKREQRLAIGPVNTMERINDKLTAGKGSAERGAASAERKGAAPAPSSEFRAPSSDELPAWIRDEDREGWSLLNEKEKAFARGRLSRRPQIPLAWAKLDPHSSEHCYFPWRSQGEHFAALGAALVVRGIHTIETHCQRMEHGELSNPQGYPNLLAKDPAGQWRVLTPAEVPRRPLPPERAAWPKDSPQWIYWPYASRAEHHAAKRAQMVLDGHLSREQYESLNAWSRSQLGGAYFDPLAKTEKNTRPAASAERGTASAEREEASAELGARSELGRKCPRPPRLSAPSSEFRVPSSTGFRVPR